MKYIFTILHNSECNFWQTLKKNIDEYAQEEKLDYAIEEVFVHNDEEAKKWKFAGSPQLLINGNDVDPNALKITNYHASGCRPVVVSGVLHEYVPIELIKEAIHRMTHK